MVGSPDASAQDKRDSFVVVIDVSGSMNETSATDPSKSKLEVAKEALIGAIGGLDAGSVNLGVRAFSGCGTANSMQVAPVAPVDPATLVPLIDGLDAGGLTGIERALLDAVGDLPNDSGKQTILLVSDGAETCGGDPCAAMASVVASGIQVVVNTIGFQTAGTSAEPQLECIANVTGGTSISVTDADELFDSVAASIGCGGLSVVECYAPILRFHPNETVHPMDPADFLQASELKWAADRGCDDPTIRARSELTAENLNNHFTFERDTFFSLFNSCNLLADANLIRSSEFTKPNTAVADNGASRPFSAGSRLLPTSEGFYIDPLVLSPGQFSGNEVTAPAFYYRSGNEIHYWFFFSDDPKTEAIRDDPWEHEGDWEHVVVLVAGPDKFVGIEYHGHGCQPVSSTKPELDGTHPVVYVARGSHAMYEAPRPAASWPASCPSLAQDIFTGTTDEAAFTAGVSKTWRTWEHLRPIEQQPWYGFGGAWGDRGIQGPHYADLVFPPPDAPGLHVDSGIDFVWTDTTSMSFLGGLPGESFVVVLESLPTIIATGALDSSGAMTVSVTIPDTTPPGDHALVLRSADSGRVLGVRDLFVSVPPDCLSDGSTGDVDGDWLLDECDKNPLDGPLADFDGDGVPNGIDNCPTTVNPDQVAGLGRRVGDACNSVLGVNPVATYPSAFAIPGPNPPPSPAPTPTAEPRLSSPDVTNRPPDQGGAYGFGDPVPNPQGDVPVQTTQEFVVLESAPTSSPTSAQPGGIAHSGVTTSIAGILGSTLVGAGALILGTLRRREGHGH